MFETHIHEFASGQVTVATYGTEEEAKNAIGPLVSRHSHDVSRGVWYMGPNQKWQVRYVRLADGKVGR